ncbi:MAG: class I SAM-dependent methyltransferase [Alphaproteobacteria bacterium]|nr:class I SAM-dependent methyltransferase [Alphaproteobacteria bacterium]
MSTNEMQNRIDILLPDFFVSRETLEKFIKYRELLVQWNEYASLVQRETLDKFVDRHLVDSIQIVKHIASDRVSVLDVGSGAGFPGLVLSILGYKNVTLVELNKKKSLCAKISRTNLAGESPAVEGKASPTT